jgi:hypothetical protein
MNLKTSFKVLLTGIFSILTFFSLSISVYADVWVDGYYRKDGTYVRGHYRSDPDGDFSNNWSTYGNTNPYTGDPGTKTYPSNTYYNNNDRNYYYTPPSTNKINTYTTSASSNIYTNNSKPDYTGVWCLAGLGGWFFISWMFGSKKNYNH